jgi:hypothetical protein
MGSVKRRTKDQDPSDLQRPWICPICGAGIAVLTARSMLTWLDPAKERVRTALVCDFCAPQGGYARRQEDGLTNRQRTKKH